MTSPGHTHLTVLGRRAYVTDWRAQHADAILSYLADVWRLAKLPSRTRVDVSMLIKITGLELADVASILAPLAKSGYVVSDASKPNIIDSRLTRAGYSYVLRLRQRSRRKALRSSSRSATRTRPSSTSASATARRRPASSKPRASTRSTQASRER